jgi:hypothetical protein
MAEAILNSLGSNRFRATAPVVTQLDLSIRLQLSGLLKITLVLTIYAAKVGMNLLYLTLPSWTLY